MNRALALSFSLLGVIVLFGIGAALSYRKLWIVLLLAIAYIVVVGVGFVVKARLRRRS